jgi:hypothetical protein
MKCGFSADHVSTNDDSALKHNEVEEERDDQYCLQPLRVQFEDCTTFDSDLEVCGIHSVVQMLDQHLTRPEKRKLQNGKQHSWMH